MCSDGVGRVASVSSEFDSEASASRDLMSLNSPKKLSALASEHRADDQFYPSLALEVGPAG